MHVRKIVAATLIVGFGIDLRASAQDLDVASIRPHNPHNACTKTEVLPGGTVRVECYTLELILREALDILPDELHGGHGWIRKDTWDIVAKSTNPTTKSDEGVYRGLLFAIAQQRFHVKLRTEQREGKGLALVVAHAGKLGPDIHRTAGGPHSFDVKPGPILQAQNTSIKELAKWLRWPTASGRDVADDTGLPGMYDFALRWTPLKEEEIKDPSINREAPTIFSALQEQLGLKLRTTNIQRTVYIVESADRPEEN